MDNGIPVRECVEGRLYVYFRDGKTVDCGWFIAVEAEHDQLHGEKIRNRAVICPIKTSGNESRYRKGVILKGQMMALEIEVA